MVSENRQKELVMSLARYLEAEASGRKKSHLKDLFEQSAMHLRIQADRITALEAALRPFAHIGIGSDPDYQPLVRMDRDAIVKARVALEIAND